MHNNNKPHQAPNDFSHHSRHPVSTNGRMLLLLFLIILAFGGLIAYSFMYQSEHNSELVKYREDRLSRTIREPALRGTITDRNGTILAVSRHLKIATFSPKAIYTPKNKNAPINWNIISNEQFQALAEILGESEKEIKHRLMNTNSQYVSFKTELDLDKSNRLKALKIPTLRFEQRSERSYPTENLFSHIVGFANNEGKGLEGLEYTQNDNLKGKDGQQMVLRDRYQNIVDIIDSPNNRPAENGKNMVLSVEYNMQKLARTELAKGLQAFRAKAGGVVVLDAQTGEILALASLPDYDANHYQDFSKDNLRNFAVGVSMEPGSIIKPLVIAKALDEGKITRHTSFNTHPYLIAQKTIQDTVVYPKLTTEGIIQKSSNVGTSLIASKIDNQDLYDYFKSLGFGQRTDSGISGEQFNHIREPQKWSKLDKAVMSYGYAISVNLLQMAQSYTIFTTNGKLMPATIFKQNAPQAGIPIIQPETAKQMREMMISVTRAGGTGTAGAVAGYDVAGKTGTAKKVVNGEYEGKYRASFVGFAPAKRPRVIVAVTLDEPRGKEYYGGKVAGPIFRNVMSGALKQLGVKPDYYVPAEQTVDDDYEASANEIIE